MRPTRWALPSGLDAFDARCRERLHGEMRARREAFGRLGGGRRGGSPADLTAYMRYAGAVVGDSRASRPPRAFRDGDAEHLPSRPRGGLTARSSAGSSRGRSRWRVTKCRFAFFNRRARGSPPLAAAGRRAAAPPVVRERRMFRRRARGGRMVTAREVRHDQGPAGGGGGPRAIIHRRARASNIVNRSLPRHRRKPMVASPDPQGEGGLKTCARPHRPTRSCGVSSRSSRSRRREPWDCANAFSDQGCVRGQAGDLSAGGLFRTGKAR